MRPDALRMLARQLRTDPNAEAVEDAAAALEACARERDSMNRQAERILASGLIPALASQNKAPTDNET